MRRRRRRVQLDLNTVRADGTYPVVKRWAKGMRVGDWVDVHGDDGTHFVAIVVDHDRERGLFFVEPLPRW